MPLTDDAFEALVQHLQQQTFTDALDAYGEKGFDRWRNPRFNEPISNADATAMVSGSCGDSIGLSLKFRDNRVENAAYRTDGCASSALCGSFAAELSIGRTPEELLALTPSDILQAIGRFPREERHCATLAIQALQLALKNYQQHHQKAGESGHKGAEQSTGQNP